MKKVVVVSLISLLIILFSIVAIFMLFPRKYKDDVERYAREYNLSASMVASVINIESGYDENAVSKVGAMGLMQLLPDTAFDCAKRVGIEVSEEQLFDKDITGEYVNNVSYPIETIERANALRAELENVATT